MNNRPHELDKISFTADGIAARRTLMDIPHSQEIYNEILKKVAGTPDESVLTDALKPENLYLVPFFEARYRLLDHLIRATGAKNILEVAAGLAPRGIIWSKDSKVDYVEIDLPNKSADKHEIVQALKRASKIEHRSNLHLVSGDACVPSDMIRAASTFGKGPVVVANEGLLRYLTFDQKRRLAANIRFILSKSNGWWITPDINLKNEPLLRHAPSSAYTADVQKRIDINIEENVWETVPEARAFFESLGFEVAVHSFMDIVPKLVSPTRINMSEDELIYMLEWRVAFVMNLA